MRHSQVFRVLPKLLSAYDNDTLCTWHVCDFGRVYFDVYVIGAREWEGRTVLVLDRVSGRITELGEESSAILDAVEDEIPASNRDLAVLACEVVLRQQRG